MHPLRLEVCLQHHKVKTSCEYHRWAYIYCETIFWIFNFRRKLLQSPYKYIALSHLQTPLVSCLCGYLSAGTHMENPTYCTLCQEGYIPSFRNRHLDFPPKYWCLRTFPGPAQILDFLTLFNAILLYRAASKRLAFLQCTAEGHPHHRFKS